jgi:hypothetical protein
MVWYLIKHRGNFTFMEDGSLEEGDWETRLMWKLKAKKNTRVLYGCTDLNSPDEV